MAKSSPARVTRRQSRRGIGGNNPPANVMSADDCINLANSAFGEVDEIEKLTLVSVQHMAAACMGYHGIMSSPPELGYYTMPNQTKSRELLWLSMFDFFMPKESRVKAPAPDSVDKELADKFEAQKRRRNLVERGLELASWIARCHLSLDQYKAEVGMWELPLTAYCLDGYEPMAEADVISTLMDGKRWYAMRKAKAATKTRPAVTSDLDRWFASTSRFIFAQQEKAKPKLDVPAPLPTTPATPATPASATPAAPAPATSVTTPVLVGDTEPEGRDVRLPSIVAATQTIGGWCNAAIKELRSTDNGALVYPTLKTLNDADREALVLLVKIYDEMVQRGANLRPINPVRTNSIPKGKAA